MNTIHSMLEQSGDFDSHKADYSEFASSLSFDDVSQLIVPPQLFGNVPPMTLTDWAFGQLFSKLGSVVFGKGSNKSLPSDYLLSIPPDLRAHNLNRHLKTANGTGWLIRSYQDPEQLRCRAILSEGYSIIANTELLSTLDAVTSQQATTDFRIASGSHISPDDLNLKTVWRDTSGGHYGIGVYVGNGEIGNRRLRVYPMIKRTSCDNSIIIEHDKGMEFVHRGSAVTKMVLFKSIIAEIFPVAAEMLNKLIAAEDEHIPDFSTVLDGLAIKYGWDDKTKTQVTLGTEGSQTRAGVVNGITYAAHTTSLSANEQADMEILGGRILVAHDSLFRQAAYAAKAQEAR